MSGLTTEQHQKLIESIRQWGESQTRIQAEQDHQAALAAILKGECGISEKHFKRVAKAYWDDKVEKDRADAELRLIDHWPACRVVNLSDKDAGRK